MSPPSHHQYHKISNCILIAFRSQGKTAFPPSQIELRLHISAGKIMKPAFYPILSAVVSFFANHQPSPAKPIVNCGCLVDHPSLKAKHGTQPPMAMLDKPGTLVDIRQAVPEREQGRIGTRHSLASTSCPVLSTYLTCICIPWDLTFCFSFSPSL